jgi:hypothetical protein
MTYTIGTGDCTDEKAYPPGDASVDMIIADPAYMDWTAPRKKNQDGAVVGWSTEVYRKICEIALKKLKPTGWFILKFNDTAMLEIYPVLKEYFQIRRVVPWNKGRISTGGDPRSQCEYLVFFHQYNKKPYHKRFPQEPPRKWHGNSRGRSFPAYIDVYAPNGGEKGLTEFERVHCCQTPPWVWAPTIKYFVPPGGLVVDFCMGSGSIPFAVKIVNDPDWGVAMFPPKKKHVDTNAIDHKKQSPPPPDLVLDFPVEAERSVWAFDIFPQWAPLVQQGLDTVVNPVQNPPATQPVKSG